MAHIARNTLRLATAAVRTFNAAPCASVLSKSTFVPIQLQPRRNASTLDEIHYNLKAYNQYGLLQHDLPNETDVVKEALKRMPANEYVRRVI